MLFRVEISLEDKGYFAGSKRRLMQRVMDAVVEHSREEKVLVNRVAIVEPPKPKKKRS